MPFIDKVLTIRASQGQKFGSNIVVYFSERGPLIERKI
jgi:hypothetical protein